MKTAEQQRERVRAAYAEVARTRHVDAAAACCSERPASPDYTAEEIASVPAGAFLGEGSGNPVRVAAPRVGETVIDLGCGAGMDAFLAANAVGARGRVLAFDMTDEMLDRARRNQAAGDYPQVEFAHADIADLPVPDGSADVAISNCVINLAPDKAAVYREIFRSLRPGGRFAIADIVLRGDAPLVRCAADRLPGPSCVATALEEGAYLELIAGAGFGQVRIADERPALAADQIRRYAEVLGVDPDDPPVSAHAVTLVGLKPGV